ncbi:MAG: response regulator transcription factor [Chitinophagaceae bacterium]|nr:response regulator transcription factor [Chitinophagaceae bacterium]MBK8953228.1 response regulator transcription factor [Chitinophagaceae bacterium]
MITAILVDDEKNALEVLEMQLNHYCKDVNIVATCEGGTKGIAAIKKHEPDLVFLDIEMPHKNGFDVLNETKDLNYKVIFTTAYDQFAIKAFKFSAVDYLLKPVDITELQKAVEKSKSINNGSLDEKLQMLLNHLRPGPQKLTHKIALPVDDAMQFMEPDDIIRCESDSNYTHIFLANGKKITMAKTLKEVEENITGTPFFRIHQSHLVNMNHISKYIKGDNAYVIMKDGTQIGISRNKKEAFLETFRKV